MDHDQDVSTIYRLRLIGPVAAALSYCLKLNLLTPDEFWRRLRQDVEEIVRRDAH
mgnify:FL=1